MNRDQFEGGVRHLKGRVRTAAGSLAGDPVRQVKGAVDQVAGGAQYAYGRARERAEDFADDGRHLLEEARRHGHAYVEEARDRGERYAREARHRAGEVARYADDNRGLTLVALAALAFAAGWLLRSPRR